MIKLFDGWEIDATDCGYTLQKRVTGTPRNGGEPKEYTAEQTYHGTIAQAVTALTQKLQRREVKANDLDAAEAIRRLNAIQEKVSTAINEGDNT